MTTDNRRSPLPDWAGTVLGMVWLALFPFWQDGSFSRITHSKWIGMLVLTGVTVVTALHAFRSRPPRTGAERLRTGVMQLAALGYFLWVALSALWGRWADILNDSLQLTVLHGAERHEGLYTQLCYAAIFLCMSLAPVRIRPLLTAAADALIIFCAVVALQYAEVNVLGLFPAGRSIRTNYEFQGLIGNIDMVSGYVCLVMPALLGGFVCLPDGRASWLAGGLCGVLLMLCMQVQSGLIAMALMLLCLLLLALWRPECRARTAFVLGGALVLLSVRLLLGLPWLDGTENLAFPHAFAFHKLLPSLMGGLLLGAGLLLRRHPGRRLPWWVVAAIALLLAAAVLLVLGFAPMPQGSGLWEMQELLHGRPQDAYGSERIGIWRLTLEMCSQSPVFGFGPDTFLYAMEDHMLQTGQTLVQRFDNPHNMLLAVLFGSGIPALTLFIALHALAVALPLWGRGRRAALPLALGLTCYMAQGFFTFSICLVSPMHWAVLGMLAAGPAHDERIDRP